MTEKKEKKLIKTTKLFKWKTRFNTYIYIYIYIFFFYLAFFIVFTVKIRIFFTTGLKKVLIQSNFLKENIKSNVYIPLDFVMFPKTNI